MKKFITNDLGLASAIMLNDISTIEVKWSQQNRIYYVFKTSNELEDLVSQYYEGTLQVEPMAFNRMQNHIPQIGRDDF